VVADGLAVSPREHPRGKASAGALLLVIFLTPLWWVHLVRLPHAGLTVGRLALIAGAGLVVFDALRFRRSLRRPPPATLVLGGAVVGLGGWMIVNSAIWGCQCNAAIDGYVELASVLLWTVAVLLIDPRWGTPVILASGAAMLFAAVLALVGVHGLEPGAVDLSATRGRLAGTYGNSNYLGTAIAAAVPILVAFRPPLVARPLRMTLPLAGWAVAAAVIVTTAVLTYSRSALIAAAAGGLFAVVLGVAGRRRRMVAAFVGLAVLVVIGLITYPTVESHRLTVSTPAPPDRTLRFVDSGGWDGRAEGLIPRGPTAFHNNQDRTSIIVMPRAAGQGISFPWGRARRGVAYRLRFEARGLGAPTQLSFGMEDHQRGNGPRKTTVPLSTRFRSFQLIWRPTATSADAQLYVWQSDGRAPFEVRNVRVARPIDMRLRGTQYDQIVGRYRHADKKGEESRLTGVQLGWKAFKSQPVRGIGWEHFRDYAARHSTFGRLSSHNDYVRMLAELGIAGVLFLLALVVSVLSRLRGAGRSRTLQAAAGVVVTGGVGFAFLTGLEAPAVSIPFAVAAALLCSRREASPLRDPRPDHVEPDPTVGPPVSPSPAGAGSVG
jgi:hypothetical protein